MLWWRASGLPSPTVVPASTVPWRWIAPVRARIASSSVVLPLWNGPTSAMHRGPLGLLPFCPISRLLLAPRVLPQPGFYGPVRHRLRPGPHWQGDGLGAAGGTRLRSFVVPGPPPGRVADVQDDDFVGLDGVEDEVSESANVYAANARLFRFLSRIGLLAKL